MFETLCCVLFCLSLGEGGGGDKWQAMCCVVSRYLRISYHLLISVITYNRVATRIECSCIIVIML